MTRKRRIIKKQIRRIFPQLASGNFQVTSKRTEQYNCVAWGALSNAHWWDPAPGYYWPPAAAREGTVEGVANVFEGLGFVPCPNADLEPEVEKIAIYGDATGYGHVSRQLPDGSWSSKLGSLEDITHQSLQDLEGPDYGRVMALLQRARPR